MSSGTSGTGILSDVMGSIWLVIKKFAIENADVS
jgi:hypothetical protein